MADLTTDLGKITLKNPVMTASGTFGYGAEYHKFYDIAELGAVVVKGIAPFQSHGNPTPRVAETACGLLNAIGLQGPGIDKFLHDEHYLPFLRTTDATVIVNIWGRSIGDYAEVARRLEADKNGIAALEINISCPNVKAGGIAFGTDKVLAAEVVSAVREATSLPLITKLSPNVSRSRRQRHDKPDQHADRYGDRHRKNAFQAGQPHRRSFRAGDQAGGGQDGVRGGACGEHSGDRHGRNHDRRRRGGIFVGRSACGGGRNRHFQRPVRTVEGNSRYQRLS